MARVARVAERQGFSAAFVAETQIIRDGVTALTAMLLATTRLTVGLTLPVLFPEPLSLDRAITDLAPLPE